MKKKILMVILPALFISAILHAQFRKIPAAVTDAFKEKYPAATNVEWKDNLTNFEAGFKLDSTEWSAQFYSKGEWKASTKKMKFDDVPDAVKDGFDKSKYSDWKPGSVHMIQDNDKDAIYKIYAEKSGLLQKVFLYFNEDGQLKKETPGI